MEQFITWSIIAWLLFGVLAIGLTVGKPRRPVTPGVALAAMVVNVLISFGVFYLAAR